MDGLHFGIAVSEIDREMRQNVRGAGPHGGIDPDEHRQQASRLRRLFRLDRAPAADVEPPTRLPGQRRPAA